MKSEIVLLSIMKCGTDTNPYTRVTFAFADIQDTKKYKGVASVSCFYTGYEVYEKLSKAKDLILKKVPATFEFKDVLYDALATKKILKTISNIDLY